MTGTIRVALWMMGLSLCARVGFAVWHGWLLAQGFHAIWVYLVALLAGALGLLVLVTAVPWALGRGVRFGWSRWHGWGAAGTALAVCVTGAILGSFYTGSPNFLFLDIDRLIGGLWGDAAPGMPRRYAMYVPERPAWASFGGLGGVAVRVAFGGALGLGLGEILQTAYRRWASTSTR